MARNPVTVFATDLHFASAIQTRLSEALGHSALVRPAEPTLDGPAANTPGLVLYAIHEPCDVGQLLVLARVRGERGLPALIPVVTGAATGECDRLAWPERSRPVCWPDGAPELVERVGRSLGQDAETSDWEEEPLAEALARRLGAQTPSLRPLAQRLAIAASHDMTVLLTGETGSGKTYLARLIHEFSPRRQHRLLVVPCGCLAPNLAESEFFGHTKGAFTGADQVKRGKFAAAGDGTLLLDEIDALSLEQQGNLLRVIDTGEYEPVGSNVTEINRARIITASNLDLEHAVADGRFRQDLFFRVAVMSFHLAPLRERVEDVAPLARGMARASAQRFHKNIAGFTEEAIAALEAFPWPGNIRQLENVVQQAVLVCNGPEIRLCHLPQPLQRPAVSEIGSLSSNGGTLSQSRQELERTIIEQALADCNYSRSRAAKRLGVSRVTLYKKMKKYRLFEKPARS
jgi:DNA-binding NtrC family response regulator